MLASCGFQLRSSVALDNNLQPVFVAQTGPIALRNELSRLLQINGVALTAEKAEALSELRIKNENMKRRVLSVDSRGRARQYTYTYTVNYSIRYADKKSIKQVKLSRDLLFDPDSVLGINYETQALREDMRDDAIRLMLQQLQAVR